MTVDASVPLHCPMCVRQFTRKDSLHRHIMNVHHDKKRYVCDHCNKRFDRKSQLGAHSMAYCEFCLGDFKCKAKLKQHISQMHNGAAIPLSLWILDVSCHIDFACQYNCVFFPLIYKKTNRISRILGSTSIFILMEAAWSADFNCKTLWFRL